MRRAETILSETKSDKSSPMAKPFRQGTDTDMTELGLDRQLSANANRNKTAVKGVRGAVTASKQKNPDTSSLGEKIRQAWESVLPGKPEKASGGKSPEPMHKTKSILLKELDLRHEENREFLARHANDRYTQKAQFFSGIAMLVDRFYDMVLEIWSEHHGLDETKKSSFDQLIGHLRRSARGDNQQLGSSKARTIGGGLQG